MREVKKPNFVKNKKLVKTSTFLAILLVAATLLSSSLVTAISISGNTMNLNTIAKPMSIRDISPNVKAGLNYIDGSRDMWDVQFSLDVTTASGAAGNAGAEWDGDYFYTNRWASNLIHKYNPDGTLVGAYTITGVSGLRDLAFDGTYMWGGNGGGTLWKMDFNSWSLLATFTGSFSVRPIAYDTDLDIIYAKAWGDPVYKIDPSNGAILGTFNFVSVTSTYGLAYDSLTAGGPYLWVYDQGAGAGTAQYIHQWDIAAGAFTGVTHDTTVEFPDPSGIAGGLFFTDSFSPGYTTLGGLQQGVPDRLFCYEIGTGSGGGPEHDVQVKSIDQPNSGAAAGSFTPKVTIKNNGNNSESSVPVNMQIKSYGTPSDYWCDGFESGIFGGWTFPSGWTVSTTNPTGTWYMYSSSTTYSASTYPRVQETTSDGNAQDESLISPSIDCSALSWVHVQFTKYHYSPTAADATFTLYISIGGGAWTQIAQYTATSSTAENINVTTYAAGQSDVRFRFRFESPADATLTSYLYFDNFWVGAYLATPWGPYGSNPPIGWSIQNYPTNPTTWNYNYWHRYTSTYTSYDSILYPARIYYTSPYETVDCAIITPTINCVGLSTVKLYLNGYFYYYSTNPGRGYIEVSTDGVNWFDTGALTTVTKYFYEFDGYNNIDISAWAANQPNVQVRFRYEHTAAEAGRYWYLSNVRVGSDRDNIIFRDSFQGKQAYSTNFKIWAPDNFVTWAWQQVTGNSAGNKWNLLASGASPSCVPYEGVKMAQYNSYSATAGDTARLYQLTPVSVGTATSLKVGFWMYHYTSGGDKIQVQYDDQVSGWQNAGSPINLMGTAGWAYHMVDVPVPTSGQIQIGFLGISAYGYNIHIDDVCLFDPGIITEYSQTKYVSLAVGETKEVTFPNWVPAAWHNQENINIIYPMSAWTALSGDENPGNDLKSKEITLSYPFFHDIAVVSVNSPPLGRANPAKTLPVESTIKNIGQYQECCYQTGMQIGKVVLGSVFYNEPFTVNNWNPTNTKWSKVSSANAGGTSPEYRFYYSPSETGTFMLKSPAINTVGHTAARLSFKHMVNHFTTPYTLAFMTSSDGTNWNTVWSIDPSASVPATTVEVDIAGLGSPTFYMAFAFIGYSYNINYWYVDDVMLTDMSMVPEYSEVQCTIVLDPGESTDLSFDDWTPADLALRLSGSIGYIAEATQLLPGDTNPANDKAGSSFVLDYWHDVKVKDITAPAMLRGDVIFAQRPYLPTESWSFATSSIPAAYECMDDFADLTQTIGGIEFFGVCLIYSGGWTPGNQNALEFEVKFYEDNAGAPGNLVTTIQLPASTPVQYNTFSGFPAYHWVYEDLGESVALVDGWMSIQSKTASDNSWLLWSGSPEGNMNALQNGAALGYDLAFNLTAGGAPGPADVDIWVPLNSNEAIAGIVANLGTFDYTDLTCFAEIWEFITDPEGNGTLIYQDSVAGIALDPLGDEETVSFDNYIFAMEGVYNLILNIPLTTDVDDLPANNMMKLGIGCDNTKPTSTHSLSPATPDGCNGWYVSDVTVTLDATDGNQDWQSGVKEIIYKKGTQQGTIAGGHGSFKVEDDGENIPIEYWAVDKVGNEESPHHTFSIDMDQSVPTVSLTYEVTGGNPITGYEFTFTATATDDMSLMERVDFYFNNVFQTTVTGSGPTYQWIFVYNPIPKAYIKAIAYDLACNNDFDEIEDPNPVSNEQSLPSSATTVKINLGR